MRAQSINCFLIVTRAAVKTRAARKLSIHLRASRLASDTWPRAHSEHGRVAVERPAAKTIKCCEILRDKLLFSPLESTRQYFQEGTIPFIKNNQRDQPIIKCALTIVCDAT